MTPRRWWPAAGLPALLLALLAGPSTLVGQRSLVLERFHAEVEILPSGDLRVTETLRPRFVGPWNGIRRQLNLRHVTAAGSEERLDAELLSASDGSGRPLRYEVNRVGASVREFKVWVENARDRTAEVVLRYRVVGAIRFFAADSAAPAFDELYWEVTGTESEVPIEDASVLVLLPPGAAPLRAAAYRGVASSRDPAPVQVAVPGGAAGERAREVRVPASGYLAPGEGLTVAVAWPAGRISMPAGARRAPPVAVGPTGSVAVESGPAPLRTALPLAWLPLLLPFLAFWLAYRAWDRRGRDPAPRAIAVRWEPPEGLDPAQTGTLVDHAPEMHDIVAILVHLAVRGYVVIEEREARGFLGLGTDYAFHLVRPRGEWHELARHERRFLDGLFSGENARQELAALATEGSVLDRVLEAVAGEPASEGAPPGAVDSVRLSDLRNRFYKKVPGIKDAILDSLVETGHYRHRPDRVRMRWGAVAAGAFALVFPGVVAFTLGTATARAFGLSLAAGGIGAGAVLAVFAFLMTARTELGARTREVALGFRRFLERVESPRYRRMIRSPDQFEAYLPYAMAFRCADRWAEAFDGLLEQPPEWYHGAHGTGGFQPTAFARDLGSLASAASSTLASSPSSSGSGGGGSVGGGSGGGGVGGF